jgi:hypothetical protein
VITSDVRTKSGLVISKGFVRVLNGGRGSYVEIRADQIVESNIGIPLDKVWRLSSDKVYYVEYRTKDNSNVKIYHQRKPVEYADYKVGFYYVAAKDVRITPNHSLYEYGGGRRG